ncbi:hypothetical protein IW139_006540, partial [Coemansia sp. RSA 353]
NILRMICPHADCQAPDTATAISDSELAKLVSNEQMKRIRRLRNQRRAETDSTNYAMCARTGCDLVVKNDTQAEDGSSKERKYLERRHGKAFMRQYRRYIEEALSLEYIDANSVQCPK